MNEYAEISHEEVFLREMELAWRMSAVGTWCYSQGIYVFDDEIYASLMNMDLPDNIPMEVFRRIPEWSLYIYTPGFDLLGEPVYGVYVHLEYELRIPAYELRVYPDTDNPHTLVYPISLAPGVPVSKSFATFGRAAAESKFNSGKTEPMLSDAISALSPILSLLLYICSDEPEISNGHDPIASPHRTAAVKVKGGYKLFSPSTPRIWDIGITAGRTIKEYRDTEYHAQGKKSPHLRRAHWHGYWKGHKNSLDREFFYR